MRPLTSLIVGLVICVVVSAFAKEKRTSAFAGLPEDKTESLKSRLSEYVDAYKTRNWEKLYSFISDTGRGGMKQQAFVSRMQQAHGVSLANYPDLLKFNVVRADKSDGGGFDLFGCGEAQREGEKYKGVAVVHAVFEHENWFFAGWSFDGMASGSCSEVNQPDWQPFAKQNWNGVMEELR